MINCFFSQDRTNFSEDDIVEIVGIDQRNHQTIHARLDIDWFEKKFEANDRFVIEVFFSVTEIESSMKMKKVDCRH